MDTEITSPTESPAKRTWSKRTWILFISAGIFSIIAIGLSLSVARLEAEHSQIPKPVWTSYSHPVNGLTSDSSGQVWAVSSNSLKIYSGNQEKNSFHLPPEINCDWFCSLAVDEQGHVWVSGKDAQREGIIVRRDVNGQWAHYIPEKSDAMELVFDLVMDGQGRAWVRSLDKLAMIDPKAEQVTYSFNNSSLPEQTVDALTVDDQGRVWVEAGEQIWMLEAEDNWALINERPNCKHGCPWGKALAVDHQGHVWRGTYSGVSVLQADGIWQVYSLGNPEVSNEIYSIVIDSKNRVWAYGNQGVFKFDAETGWKQPDIASLGLPYLRITAFILDKQDRVWIATEDGANIVLSVSSDIETILETQAVQNTVQNASRNLRFNIRLSGVLTVVFVALGILSRLVHQGKLTVISYIAFFIFFFGWFGFHTLFWPGYINSGPGLGGLIWMSLIVPLVNIGVLVWLFRAKQWGAFAGMLTAILGNIVALILSSP